jgi:hypothetical protein
MISLFSPLSRSASLSCSIFLLGVMYRKHRRDRVTTPDTSNHIEEEDIDDSEPLLIQQQQQQQQQSNEQQPHSSTYGSINF